MFEAVDFSSVWEGITNILPSLSDVMAMGAAFWAAGMFAMIAKRFMGIKKSNKEEEEA